MVDTRHCEWFGVTLLAPYPFIWKLLLMRIMVSIDVVHYVLNKRMTSKYESTPLLLAPPLLDDQDGPLQKF